ncbi:hypothetical protein ACN95_00500 [Gordonia sihwensis]|uniref:hypothetical protein n=1 Tax=Gordonia sihwensis TaxID=173559 RepID=UPI001C92FED0|nr:hypothetical protein [Gordonia sihwensis]MBY4568504.1 hypothetical protein [Gordonia sihwensis]
MAVCDICGNEYKHALLISVEGREGRGVYDSFECAIAGHAPRCTVCDTPIIGHGVQSDGRVFCCVHCAQRGGDTELVDRVGTAMLH